jgi:uncharacterized protein (DUF58 family)
METLEDQLSSVYIVRLVQFMVGVCLFLSLLYGQRELTTLALLVLGITIGTNLWSRLSLSGIQCSSVVDQNRLFPGESLDLNLNVKNTLFLPLWLQANMQIEGALAPSLAQINIVSNCGLLWYQQTRLNYRLVARRRGVYRVGSAHIKVGDIFGFYPRKKRTEGDTDVIVYPRLVQLKPFSLPSCDFLGSPGAKIPIQDPIYMFGTRDYQHGRPARHIYWKASARHNRLQEKIFEPSEQKKVLLAIEVNQFAKAKASESFERTLEVVGSLAVQSYRRGYALGLVTNGEVEGGSPLVSMGRSPQQLPSILEVLARLKMRAAGSLTDTLRCIPELPWGLSSVHFLYEHDEGTQATAQYFSHRRIPMIFVDCSSRPQWEGNGNAPAAKRYRLDEICIEENLKP